MQPLPKTSVAYDILRSRTYHTSDDIDAHPDLFLGVNDPIFYDTEYWMYSDLNSLYGDMRLDMKNMYPNTYYGMQDTIERPLRQDYIFNDLFKSHVATIQTVYDPSPDAPYLQHKNIRGTDLKLTRLAAWSVSCQHPSMLFARMFFLFPGATYNQVLDETIRFARIRQRKESISLDKAIAGIVKKYGGDYRICHNLINRAFFYGLDAAHIKEAHGLPDNSAPLTDYLNANALAARNLAIHKAISEFNTSPIKNINIFHELLYKHVTDGRVALLRKTNKGPENNIEKERIGKLESKLKKIETGFIRNNIDSKLR